MWSGPFSTYPRQMGYPSRNGIVYTSKELLTAVNRFNGRTTVFTSLYSYDKVSEGKPDYESAQITHLYFDLDHNDCHLNAQKLHTYLINHDLCHTMCFSGRGFHFFVQCEYPNYLKNKKDAIYNAVIHISEECHFSVGINETDDVDAHTIGNIAQLVRVPNTYNIKRKRFCIPISSQQLQLPLETIYSLASHQQPRMFIYGCKAICLDEFDREPVARYKVDSIESTESVGIQLLNIDSLPPCIKALATKRLIKHRQRYILISYLRELGLPLDDCISFLKSYLDSRTYSHCVFEEAQVKYIYSRADLNSLTCEYIKGHNLCIVGCKQHV